MHTHCDACGLINVRGHYVNLDCGLSCSVLGLHIREFSIQKGSELFYGVHNEPHCIAACLCRDFNQNILCVSCYFCAMKG